MIVETSKLPEIRSPEYYTELKRQLKLAGMPPTEIDAYIELHKKFASQRWRIDNLYQIVDADGNQIPFQMNYAQKLLYLGMWYCNIILKSRQHGITTFMCLLYLDICMFNSNTHAAIIAHNKDDAEDFFQKKVKFAYDNLPEQLKNQMGGSKISSKHLSFKNGSSIRVTTSGRSGTYQLIHISELGKICAKYPLKAQEVITGTLNAIHAGNIVTIESTAEGREGKYYEMVKTARALKDMRSNLGKKQYKFFFFGWPENDLNRLEPSGTATPDRLKDYFEELEVKHRIHLTEEQKAWYVETESTQGEFMFQEHPSTPEEAFYKSMEGAYYQKQMRAARKQGRIGRVPVVEHLPIDTYWDIGYHDETAIWFAQNVGREVHLLHYYENSGEGFPHYRDYAIEWAKEHKSRIRLWQGPHDLAQHVWALDKSVWQLCKEAGVEFDIGPRVSETMQIESVRLFLPICYFDEAGCERGIDCLDSLRKEWNDKLGCFKEKILHDWASHGASAFKELALKGDIAGAVPQPPPKASPEHVERQKQMASPKGWT